MTAPAPRAGQGEAIPPTKSPRDAIDEKIDRDGPDSFDSISLTDFLAEAGRRPSKSELLDIVNQLASANVFWYLPAISSALRDLVEDSGEFAGLVAAIGDKTKRDLVQGPLVDFLEETGSGRPDLAVRLARRLIDLGSAYHAAFLIGGAMNKDPAACREIAGSLMRSTGDEEAAAGIKCLRIAWKKGGIADAAARSRRWLLQHPAPTGRPWARPWTP